MTTNRNIVLVLANVAVLAGVAYFASIDIRGIFAPLVFLTLIDAVAVWRMLKPTPVAKPHTDHSP